MSVVYPPGTATSEKTLTLEEYTDQRYNYEPIMSKNSILGFVPEFIDELDPSTIAKVNAKVLENNEELSEEELSEANQIEFFMKI